MATVKINPTNKSDLRKRVKNLLERRWALANAAMIEVARKNGYSSPEKMSHDAFWDAVPAEIREFFRNTMAFRATQPDNWKATILDTTSFHNVKIPVHEAFATRANTVVRMRVVATKGYMLPDIDYRAIQDVILRETSPLYVPVLEMMRAHNEIIDSNQFIYDTVSNFLDNRSTYGQVRRDWPTLVSFLGENYTARLGTTTARGAKEVSEEEAIRIADIDPILLETMFRPECDGLNLRFM